jgi:hypothetical protein
METRRPKRTVCRSTCHVPIIPGSTAGHCYALSGPKLGRASPLTESIEAVLFHRSLPVDILHNVKIFREKLTPWAEEQLRGQV